MTKKASEEFSECRERRQIYKSALSDPRFRRYYVASWFSSMGSWLLRFLLGWSAWELTQSATWVGIVGALMLAPALVLSPWFGILSDRVNPKNGLCTSMVIHGGIALFGFLSMQLQLYDEKVLIILAITLGMATSLHSPMRLALVPLLVERDALPSAVGYSAMSFNVARIVAPALGAVLVAGSDDVIAWLVSTVMFVISFWVLTRLTKIKRRLAYSTSTYGSQLINGLRHVSVRNDLKLLLALTALNGLMGRTVIELLPALSGQILDGGSTELAILIVMGGVGSVVGGLVLSRQSADLSRIFFLVCSAIGLSCLVLISFAWFTDLNGLSIWIFCLGLVTTVAGTGCQTFLQLRANEAFRGRIMSLWTMVAMGAPSAGAAMLGVGADAVGFHQIFIASGLIGFISLLGFYMFRAAILSAGGP